jgi:hypothetical protein
MKIRRITPVLSGAAHQRSVRSVDVPIWARPVALTPKLIVVLAPVVVERGAGQAPQEVRDASYRVVTARAGPGLRSLPTAVCNASGARRTVASSAEPSPMPPPASRE